MPALVLVNSEKYGYAKSQNKSAFAVFVFCKKIKIKEVFFSKTSRRRLCYHQAEGVGRSWEILGESKGLLGDSWTKREVLRTNRRTQS